MVNHTVGRPLGLQQPVLVVLSGRTLMMPRSFPRMSKKVFLSRSGTSACPQSRTFLLQSSTATAARLMAPCTSSSEGLMRTAGTASCTSRSKNGRSITNTPFTSRAQMRFCIVLNDSWLQRSSATCTSMAAAPHRETSR